MPASAYPADATPSLYDEHASWFHLLTAPAEYAEEAAWVRDTLRAHRDPAPRTLLELGSGGGNLASHLTPHFEMVLTDLSPRMLALSQTINPGVEHVAGDMRTLRVGRTFDAVLVHDAVMYLLTEAELEAMAGTAAAHLVPGGLLLIQPDYVRETYEPSTESGGHDHPTENRGLRYLEWDWDPNPADTTIECVFSCILREGNAARPVHDRHRFGIFPRATWRAVLERAGFAVELLVDPWRTNNFMGTLSASRAG